jgi:hypothetical protein
MCSEKRKIRFNHLVLECFRERRDDCALARHHRWQQIRQSLSDACSRLDKKMLAIFYCLSYGSGHLLLPTARPAAVWQKFDRLGKSFNSSFDEVH